MIYALVLGTFLLVWLPGFILGYIIGDARGRTDELKAHNKTLEAWNAQMRKSCSLL